jgi:hypothetical protein
MIYLKSCAAGVVAVLGGTALVLVALVIFVRVRFHTATGLHVDLLRDPTVWTMFLVLFLLGFVIEYRRLI